MLNPKEPNSEKEFRFVRKFYRNISIVTTFAVILHYYLYNWLYKSESMFNILVYIVSNVICFGQAASIFRQYILLLLCVRSRFGLINAYIRFVQLTKWIEMRFSLKLFHLHRKHFYCQSNVHVISASSQESSEIIRSLSCLHNKLCETVHGINFCYSFQVSSPLKFRPAPTSYDCKWTLKFRPLFYGIFHL